MKTVSINRNEDRDSILMLQNLLVKYGFPIVADGSFEESTKQAVIEFQRKHNLSADGIVGYRSWEALLFANRDEDLKTLSQDDFKQVARLLDCEPAALMAVQQVETGGRGGFFDSGRPAILFEGHVFWNQLKKRGLNPTKFLSGNEDILYEKWSKAHYKGGDAEYGRLERARAIHREAADASTSWGMFQIMGFNHAACGENSVADFVGMMHRSELHQLLLSGRFINSNKRMLLALQQKNWAEFARLYNGSGYAQNKYDVKLTQAFAKYSS